MKTTLKEAVKDLTLLKEKLNSGETVETLLPEFKKKYPYQSTDKGFIELLTSSEMELPFLGKLLLRECYGIEFDEEFLKAIDDISRL